MSGIAGAVAPLGAPTDPELSRRLAAAIAYCGPDRQDSWSGEGAFLARALLASTFEEVNDRQPLSLDGKVWLVADARVDGRKALIGELRAARREVKDDAPDSELILHAYHAWGEACVERLIGDFAFAIWDERERALFCARDQFGTVPFYYAAIAGTFVFANTMEALLAHPGLDRTLNPEAIGDYLLFGYSKTPDAGFYKHVRRLPPAHSLRYRGSEAHVWRYWNPPPSNPRPLAEDERETVERFGGVLRSAVEDRLRHHRIAATLSGGMDSTLVAGFASRHAPAGARIDAYSMGSDWLLPDNERHWASLCAEHLGIPFHSVSAEPMIVSPPGGVFWRNPPEPRFELRVMSIDALFGRAAADGARVVLMGMGGDLIAASGLLQWREMIERKEFAQLLSHAWRYWRYHRRRPPIRGALQFRRSNPPPPLLSPLNPDFADRYGLQEKWREAFASSVRVDPRRSMADNMFWTEMFVACHPETSKLPLRVRQPFFDVRLIEEAMALPPTPWQFGKAILRKVGEGMLPTRILARPKTPFGASGHWAAAKRGYEPWLSQLGEAVVLDEYIDRKRLAQMAADVGSIPEYAYFRTVVLPGSLAAWLRTRVQQSSGHS